MTDPAVEKSPRSIETPMAVLSVIAMISSSNTEKKTSETLEQIVKQNELLVNKINSDLIGKNFDEKNIEDLIKHPTLQK